METAYLFTVGNLRQIKTGAILTVDCDVFADKVSDYDPYGVSMDKGVHAMALIAFRAAKRVPLSDSFKIEFL